MYKRIGKRIYDRKGKRWILKQTCQSAINSKKALRAIGMNAARKYA